MTTRPEELSNEVLAETLDEHYLDSRVREAARRLRAMVTAHPASEWREEFGAVLWWRFPVGEPPEVGDPRDDGFPADYWTHWTRLVIPTQAAGRGGG